MDKDDASVLSLIHTIYYSDVEGIGSFVRNFHIGFDHDYECH